jgi:hypothetical protein
VALLGAAAVAPAALLLPPVPVAAQTRQEYEFDPAGPRWREHRRDDLGFRVEMPGEPMVMTDESPGQSKQTVADESASQWFLQSSTLLPVSR